MGFYLLNVLGLGYGFQRTTDFTILFSAGLTTVVGIFGVPVIERYFRQWTDRIFFQDRYEYSAALHELSEILNHHVAVQELTAKTAAALQRILKVETVQYRLGSRGGHDAPIPHDRHASEIGKASSSVCPFGSNTDVSGPSPWARSYRVTPIPKKTSSSWRPLPTKRPWLSKRPASMTQ